jgi:quercetin dioxygenase-like cupin family protein
MVVNAPDVEPIFYDWGAIKWLISEQAVPGTSQSFGLANVLPGRMNPEHWHTTAQEIIYMISGECEITIEGQLFRAGPGQTIYIPAGARHTLVNNGWEPAVYVAAFSASTRGTLFDDPDHPGARPASGKGY